MREPILTIEAADQRRIDPHVEGDLGLGDLARARLDVGRSPRRTAPRRASPRRARCPSPRRRGRGRRGSCPAARTGGACRRRGGRSSPQGRRCRPSQHGADRLRLLIGGKDRRADQALEVVALRDQGAEAVEIGGNRVNGALVAGEVEQGEGVARRHARSERPFLRTAFGHDRLSCVSRVLAAAPEKRQRNPSVGGFYPCGRRAPAPSKARLTSMGF